MDGYWGFLFGNIINLINVLFDVSVLGDSLVNLPQPAFVGLLAKFVNWKPIEKWSMLLVSNYVFDFLVFPSKQSVGRE